MEQAKVRDVEKLGCTFWQPYMQNGGRFNKDGCKGGSPRAWLPCSQQWLHTLVLCSPPGSTAVASHGSLVLTWLSCAHSIDAYTNDFTWLSSAHHQHLRHLPCFFVVSSSFIFMTFCTHVCKNVHPSRNTSRTLSCNLRPLGNP